MTAADHRSGSLARSHAIAKLPAQDLERARAFYRDQLGLEPVEERERGLRYCCPPASFTSSCHRAERPARRRSSASRSRTSTRPSPSSANVAASSSDSMRPASR